MILRCLLKNSLLLKQRNTSFMFHLCHNTAKWQLPWHNSPLLWGCLSGPRRQRQQSHNWRYCSLLCLFSLTQTLLASLLWRWILQTSAQMWSCCSGACCTQSSTPAPSPKLRMFSTKTNYDTGVKQQLILGIKMSPHSAESQSLFQSHFLTAFFSEI